MLQVKTRFRIYVLQNKHYGKKIAISSNLYIRIRL